MSYNDASQIYRKLSYLPQDNVRYGTFSGPFAWLARHLAASHFPLACTQPSDLG